MPNVTVNLHPEYAPEGASFDASEGVSLCDSLLDQGIEH